MIRIAYLHASYAYYIAYQHFREALAKIANVKFYFMSDVLYENDSPLWDARDIVKEFNPDAIVVGVNNTVHRSISNLDKVDCLKIMFSDDPHNWLARKAKFMNKNKIDIMLMMNYGRWHGKPEDYPSWWLNPFKLASERPPEIYGGRMTIADKYQRQLNYKPKFINFPESVNINFFKDKNHTRTCDVFNSGSHLSSVYPLRCKIYDVLHRQPNIRCCINPSFAYSWKDYADMIAKSKMLVEGVVVFGYTSQRFTQAMASKTLMVSSLPYDNVANHFIPDKNFVEITKYNFLDKIRYYLENEKERQKIIGKAYNAVLKYHTCEVRAKQLVDIIRKKRI